MLTAYRFITLLLIVYGWGAGLLFDVPRLPILNESIRMLYVHVPMWFAMILLYTLSFAFAIAHLRKGAIAADRFSYACAEVGTWYGILGLLTGMLWAKYTWGSAWSGDPKQNAAAITVLFYVAYFVLRKNIVDDQRRMRMSALYNVLGYALMWPLIFVLPRMTDSLHPGSGGNPGFNTYDLDQGMRLVFYPAVLGWMMWGIWLARFRAKLLGLRHLTNKATIYA